MKKIKGFLAIFLSAAILVSLFAGCTEYQEGEEKVYTYDEATTELSAFYNKIKTNTKNPPIDIYDEATDVETLADINTFSLTTEGTGGINIEIAAPSELSGSSPDDWINVVANEFNNEKRTIGGKTVSVSIRKISSGEALTYISAGAYTPDAYIPSSYAWGEMLRAKGISVETVQERTLGNTAGILMAKDVYDKFISEYKTCSLDTVINATIDGKITFAYTNPYTSATGLNALASALYSFDNNNPLSDNAKQKLIEYQQKSPPVAYTTGVLKTQAAKGIINSMVMEEQAYINEPKLKDYVYTPFGIRHDHPLYTFGYVSDEKKEAVKMFGEYCLSEKNQSLGDSKGFNKHNDYQSQSHGFGGNSYLSAQSIWKQAKDGGQPIIACFIADVSGSMSGLPINSLKESLVATTKYISSSNYVGVVSYSNSVNIELPIDKFDDTQKSYFAGAIKNLDVGGSTATYDAVLVSMQMLLDKKKEVPNAKMMLFLLSDGDQNKGYSLDRIAPIVGGLKIPVYTIGYNISDGSRACKELTRLANINEAAMINAGSEDIVNQLRNLFNTQL